MELRRDERENTQHQVSVWTLDPDGNISVQEGRTLDISKSGACLSGLHRRIEPGAFIGVQNGSRRGRFKVVWSERDSQREHQIGIERVRSDAEGATRVLMVDTSGEAIDSRKPALLALGYECTTVSSASSFFETLQQSEFHLLVLAHPLANLDTMELLVGIRRSGNRTRTLLVSANPHVHESLRSMADAFVYAREPQAAFIAAIERALDRTQSKLLVTRSIHRHAVRVPFVVQVLRSGVKTSLHGTSVDLSERGIGGNIKAPLTPGEMVKVQFPLPNSSSDLEAYAIVRHRRSEFYGFEFLSIDDKSLEIIRALCAILPPLRS
jgi:DNA-binding response OmpR family regulator